MKSTHAPSANEVWISRFTGNYFCVNAIDGAQMSVTCLGYIKNIGQINEQSFITRKPDSHVWDVSTFKLTDFRRIARNSAKFKAWLKRTAVNA